MKQREEAQDKRDEEFKQWRNEQAKEQAKRDEEFKQWRNDQAKEQAKRDEKQAKRDEKQAKRDEELNQWQKKQAEALEKLVGSQFNQPAHFNEYKYSPHRRSSVPTNKQIDFTTKGYTELSELSEKNCKRVEFDEALGILGKDWKDSWKMICGTSYRNHIIKITNILKRKIGAIGKEPHAKKAMESRYQKLFGALAEAVQDHVNAAQKLEPGMFWRNTHRERVKCSDGKSRMPDGAFLISDRCDVTWRNFAVIIEIKGDEMVNDAHHIRGQILQNFFDMSEAEPRRFMIGLGVAKNGSVRVYIYTPGRVYSTPLGNMPLLNEVKLSNNALRVIQFLLLLHTQLQKDSGYLFKTYGMSTHELDLSKLADAETPETPAPIVKYDSSFVYGRHKNLNAQQTWVYRVSYNPGNDKVDAFLKFQWAFKNDNEAAVHKFLLAHEIPHVPELWFNTCLTAKGFESDNFICKGEAMLVEDVGQSVINAFDGSGLELTDAEIVDAFAGYAHTLIAAATMDTDTNFVLHRDVSTGNLMISNDKMPYVIDWGYGRICAENEVPSYSDKKMIGTAVYMSIRVLKQSHIPEI
ncbi:hypothetical protein LPJ55_005749 [Coemansia sp. RSA 990]|nr:hypothetical protein LPJ55_005749 [Coemansia sp. RSA 990]